MMFFETYNLRNWGTQGQEILVVAGREDERNTMVVKKSKSPKVKTIRLKRGVQTWDLVQRTSQTN